VLGSIAFESRVELGYDTARADHALLVDLDSDGRVDLVAADPSGRLVVRFGQGQGTFATGREVPAQAGLFHLLAADLDGDGPVDLVAVARDGRTTVFANDGDGGLTPAETLGLGADLLDVALHDVDGDGAADLVAVHLGGTGVMVLAGVGDGTFRSPVLRTFDRSPEVTGLAIDDLDGDGRAEIVSCDLERDRLVLLPGDGGAPVYIPVGSQPIAAAIGDLSSDGTKEIAVALLGARRVDVLGRTPGGWGAIQQLQAAGLPYDLAVFDLDADGQDDLVFTELDRRAVVVHRAAGQALEALGEATVATGTPIAPQFADVDGDGLGDLFVPAFGADRGNLYRGRPGGLRGGRLHLIEGIVSPEIVQVANFVNRPDLICGSFGSTALSVSRFAPGPAGDPEIEADLRIELGRNVQNVVPVDLDGDGRDELVVAVAGGVMVVRNRGPIVNFRYLIEIVRGPGPDGLFAPGDGPFEVAVADLDGDGRKDLVIAYHESDKLALLRGTADPFEFEAPEETPLSGRPVGLAVGDFDGDGTLEVAASRLAAAAVTVLQVTGGGLSVVSDTPVGPSPFYLRAADFDGDGRTDLVVGESGTDGISMLLALPGGGFRRAEIDAGEAPTALATLDLNRDGFADILVASLVGADFRVLLGDGRGGVAQSLRFPGVYGALTAAVADVDADGLADMSIGSLVSRGVAVYRNVSRPE
jgi:hypothetical protein